MAYPFLEKKLWLIFDIFSDNDIKILNIYEVNRSSEEALGATKSGPFFHASSVRIHFKYFCLLFNLLNSKYLHF